MRKIIFGLMFIFIVFSGISAAVCAADDGAMDDNNMNMSDDGNPIVYFDGEPIPIENCNFTGNTPSYGGAIYHNSNSPVINCNFTIPPEFVY